jgi:hypothetical protein
MLLNYTPPVAFHMLGIKLAYMPLFRAFGAAAIVAGVAGESL